MKIFKTLSAALLILVVLAACSPSADVPVNAEYVLTTDMRDGQFVFVGVNRDINGVVNPQLFAEPGERITVMLVNSGWGTHDIVFPELNVRSDKISKQGEIASVTFTVPAKDSTLEYYDSQYKNLGMTGVLTVGSARPEEDKTITVSNAATGTVVEYSLESNIVDGKMVFIGKGGDIDGQVNPDLKAGVGDAVKVHLTSGEGAMHNFYLDEFNVKSADVMGQDSVTVEFIAGQEGTFEYYCAIPG
ncbi:MAG: hypothetical protein L6Q26_04155, partial [Anaerolineales bacterium]|nr:hypothetical protein [Anaerolineales bacterium]